MVPDRRHTPGRRLRAKLQPSLNHAHSWNYNLQSDPFCDPFDFGPLAAEPFPSPPIFRPFGGCRLPTPSGQEGIVKKTAKLLALPPECPSGSVDPR